MTTLRRNVRPLMMTFVVLQTALLSACCISPSDFRMSSIIGKPTLPNYHKDCLAKSRLENPAAVGEIINTPHYALITLQREGQSIKAGEMCIINKTTHTIEITAIDDLQFLSLPSDAK
ncbi:MAG: hypothetical protein NVS3B3_04830 [Aquirhabdus sp.]